MLLKIKAWVPEGPNVYRYRTTDYGLRRSPMSRATWRFAETLTPNRSGITFIHSSVDGFARNRLIFERRAFSSRARFFAPRGIRVGTRFAGR